MPTPCSDNGQKEKPCREARQGHAEKSTDGKAGTLVAHRGSARFSLFGRSVFRFAHVPTLLIATCSRAIPSLKTPADFCAFPAVTSSNPRGEWPSRYPWAPEPPAHFSNEAVIRGWMNNRQPSKLIRSSFAFARCQGTFQDLRRLTFGQCNGVGIHAARSDADKLELE